MEISPEGYLHIADHETFRKEILNAESDKGMDGDDDIPAEHQTDEVKNILNQLGELNREKETIAKRILEIDLHVGELQKQLMSEKKRTSSVSDNIKIFEGLGPRLAPRDSSNLPQRAHSTVFPRKENQPSSYTHLWNLAGSTGEVLVPESFVKPNQSTPPSTLEPSASAPSESEAQYDLPPEDLTPTLSSHKEDHILLYPKIDSEPVKVAISVGLDEYVGLEIPIQSAEPSPKTSTRKLEKSMTSMVFEDEPVYVNYQTIDEYVRQESSYADVTADISEDSEHELLDVSEDDSDVTDVTGLVDHVTVRNAEEAELYSHRKKIAEKLFEKEKKYLYYLRCLEKLYIAFSNNARLSTPILTENECRIIFFRIKDLCREQTMLVKLIEKRLREWSPDSTFHEIVWSIKENLKLYEEYVNNYTRAIHLVQELSCRRGKENFTGIANQCTVPETKEVYKLSDLLYKPVDRLTHHTTVIQDVLQCTPSRHADHSKLRIYLNEFWHILSTVNKDHKSKGHRKVAEKQITKEGFITEILPSNDRKLRQVVLSSDLIMCLKPNVKKGESDMKWFIPLTHVNVDMSEVKEEISMKYKTELNNLDGKVVDLNAKLIELDIKKDKRQKQKLQDELYKTRLSRLKLSQKVPLAIRDVRPEGIIHHFMLSSEYERTLWTEAINEAQRLSFGRVTVTPYDVKDLMDQLKTRRRSPSSVTTALSPMVCPMMISPTCPKLLSGYLSVAVDQASGFHRDCNLWVALETDFYSQFTTQARTRIASTRNSDRKIGKTAHWNEEFEIEADGCEEMVALILNNQPKRNEEEQRDLLVAKGNLKLPAISGLLDGKLCHVEISMTGDIKLAVTLRYISRSSLKRKEATDVRKTFGVPLSVLCAREGRSCPYLVRATTSEIESRGMADVGLYRVSAARSDIILLKEYFDSNHPDLMRKLQESDIHTVTGTLKRFLMELPSPLIPPPYSERLGEIDFQNLSKEDRSKAIREALLGFPKENQGTMYMLWTHYNKVAAVISNKMDMTNLATVFGPTLLTSEATVATINTVQLHGNILHSILEMDQFPSFEEDPLDGSDPIFPPPEPRRPHTPTQAQLRGPSRSVLSTKRPVPAPRSTQPRTMKSNF